MGIKFILMVNKQGQTRLANYYDWTSIEERSALEAELVRKCLGRTETLCSFLDFRGMRVVYRRYASLFFIVGTEPDEDVRAQPGHVRGAERQRGRRWVAAAERAYLCAGGGGCARRG